MLISPAGGHQPGGRRRWKSGVEARVQNRLTPRSMLREHRGGVGSHLPSLWQESVRGGPVATTSGPAFGSTTAAAGSGGFNLEKDVRGSGREIDQVCPRAACLRGPSICYQWNRRLLQMTPRTGPAAKSSTGVVPLPERDVIARSALPSPRGGRHRPDGVNPIPDVGTGTFRCPERIDASSEGSATRLVSNRLKGRSLGRFGESKGTTTRPRAPGKTGTLVEITRRR